MKIPFTTELNLKLHDLTRRYNKACVLNSNGYKSKYSKFEFVFAYSNNEKFNNLISFSEFSELVEKSNKWVITALSYDLKNEFENLTSKNSDSIKFPLIDAFCPDLLIIVNEGFAEILYPEKETERMKIFNQLQIQTISDSEINPTPTINLKPLLTKDKYLKKIEQIKKHIQAGDIYEMNFCMEFLATNYSIDPYRLYQHLNKIAPAPFSCFYKSNEHFVLSTSPERYLQKSGNKIISQPIKGTIERVLDKSEDKLQQNRLATDPKERSENIMIVDMVRNDLSRTAAKGSVQVEELFGIYQFKHVHQMISTITSNLKSEFTLSDVIKTSFPMGSMTGAPKIKAMELIEKYEASKRGIYSGTIGYIDEKQNADFNVIIRSIIYNSENKKLSFQVGSAITIASDPEKEYEECMLKAKGMLMALEEK